MRRLWHGLMKRVWIRLNLWLNIPTDTHIRDLIREQQSKWERDLALRMRMGGLNERGSKDGTK